MSTGLIISAIIGETTNYPSMDKRDDIPLVCLGIDVGYGRMGVAKLSSRGEVIYIDCIETTAKYSFQDRLYYIFNKLVELMRDCNVIAYEEPMLKGRNGANLNQVVGAINIVSASYGLIPYKYSPSTIKQTVTGKGSADKPHVAKVLIDKYPSIDTDLLDDSYDALACALTYFMKNPKGQHYVA